MNICSACDQQLTTWDYRYRGYRYCRGCYDRLFKLQICSGCGKQKKISINLQIPVCKKCQVKDKPCIRCGKTEYVPGKITLIGPVCNSCSKYFRDSKTCSLCIKQSNGVSNRTLSDNTVKLLCQSCYNKTLPICYHCGKQRKAYTLDENGHSICEVCVIEKERICKQCGKHFPAGKGRICGACVYENTLYRKSIFGSKTLSHYMSDVYIQFGDWLKQRRGVLFAATHINIYLPYFSKLDALSEAIGRAPTYTEVVGSLSVAQTRSNLLPTLFLDSEGIIGIDKKVQEEYSNIDMITRYLERFEEGTWAQKAIDGYFKYLKIKTKNKSSVRSMRLALGTAANLLSYMECLHEHIVSTASLHGYLWKYPGQTSSITGFVNFIKREFHRKVEMPLWKYPQLLAPKQSRMHLKQQLIDLLRESADNEDYKSRLVRTAISYLHGVDIPENIYLSLYDLKRSKSGDAFIRIAGRKLYLPEEIIKKI